MTIKELMENIVGRNIMLDVDSDCGFNLSHTQWLRVIVTTVGTNSYFVDTKDNEFELPANPINIIFSSEEFETEYILEYEHLKIQITVHE